MNYAKFNEKILEAIYWIPLSKKPETIIPDNIEIIGELACHNLNDLTEVVIPPSVKEIRSGAFSGCKNLRKVIIPATVEKVYDGAFADCTSLTEVKYSYHTKFGSYCFSGCSALKTINDGTMEARVFYMASHNQFAITKTYKTDEVFIPTGYSVFIGKFINQHFPIGVPDTDKPFIFFVTATHNGVDYMWYDTDLKQAIRTVDYQLSKQSPAQFLKKHWGFNDTINCNDFGLLTGMCFEGLMFWNRVFGGDRTTPFSISMILSWLHKWIPSVYERFKYVLEHQDDPVPIYYYTNGIQWKDLKKN